MSKQSTDIAQEPLPTENAPPKRTTLRGLSSKLLVRPPTYLVASIIISVGGTLFGLDTGCIGPVTSMPEFVKSFGQYSSAMHGLIVSSILITASVSSFFAGHLADEIGRPHAVMAGSAIFSLGAALEASAVNLPMFICSRAVKGVGEGMFLSTLTVYICEISPARKRGPLASIVQFMITVGICVGFFICYGSVRIPASMSWRLPSAVQSAIAMTLAVSCLKLPPSPRWMMNKGRYAEARVVMDRLELSQAELETNPAIASDTLTESSDSTIDLKSANRFFVAFSPQFRKQTILGIFLMIMCQVVGIDGVLYYAPTLFKQAGLSSTKSSFLASGVTGIVNVVATVPASFLADHWDRRTSLISGGVGTGIPMLVIGSLYAAGHVHPDQGIGRWVVVTSIYLYTIAFAVSWAVTIKIYITEVQPARTRAAASSLGQGANWVANFLIAFTTPIFLAHSSCGAYFLFAFFAWLTVVACALYMPETRGRPLEAIEGSFNRSFMGTVLSNFAPNRKVDDREDDTATDDRTGKMWLENHVSVQEPAASKTSSSRA